MRGVGKRRGARSVAGSTNERPLLRAQPQAPPVQLPCDEEKKTRCHESHTIISPYHVRLLRRLRLFQHRPAVDVQRAAHQQLPRGAGRHRSPVLRLHQSHRRQRPLSSIQSRLFTEFHPSVPHVTELYRVLPNFFVFYLVSPSFAEFYQVLPRFTGFDLSLTSFT